MNKRSYPGIFYYFSIIIIAPFLILTLSHNALAADDISVFSKNIEDISTRVPVKFAVKTSNKTRNIDSSENTCYELSASFGDSRSFFDSLNTIKNEGVFTSSEISSIEAVKDERERIFNGRIFVIKSRGGETADPAAKRSRIYERKFSLLSDMITQASNSGVSISGFYYLPDLKIEVNGNSASLDSVLAYAYALAEHGMIISFSDFSSKTVYSRELGAYYQSFRITAVMK